MSRRSFTWNYVFRVRRVMSSVGAGSEYTLLPTTSNTAPPDNTHDEAMREHEDTPLDGEYSPSAQGHIEPDVSSAQDYTHDDAISYLCSRLNLSSDMLGYGHSMDERMLLSIIKHIERLEARAEADAKVITLLAEALVEESEVAHGVYASMDTRFVVMWARQQVKLSPKVKGLGKNPDACFDLLDEAEENVLLRKVAEAAEAVLQQTFQEKVTWMSDDGIREFQGCLTNDDLMDALENALTEWEATR